MKEILNLKLTALHGREILRLKFTALCGREILSLKVAAVHGREILRFPPISLLDACHGNGVGPSERSHIKKKQLLYSKCITKFFKLGKAPGYADAR
jgi:hypothetical protein